MSVSGYKHDLFVKDPPAKYHCLFCSNVVRDAHQHTGCGKIFCKDCLKSQFKNLCPSCNKTLTKSNTAKDTQVDEKVKGLSVKCPKCIWKGELRKVDTHRAECAGEPVSCQYELVGCKERPKRCDREKHNEDYMSKHLQLAVNDACQLRTEIKKLKQDHTKIEKKRSLLTSVEFKMENVAKFRSAKTSKGRTWYSSNFFTNSTMGYTARLQVDVNGAAKTASCCICLTAGVYDTRLEWPFKGTFTVSVLNQSPDENDYSGKLKSENATQPTANDDTVFGEQEFIPFAMLLSQDHRSRFLVDNCLNFKVTVDSVRSKIPDLA